MTMEKMPAVTARPDSKGLPAFDVERVLDIAVTQFAEQGFDGVSMRELSRESACPTPSIYYHFNSKVNLYHQAYEHKIEQTTDFIRFRLAGASKTQRFEVLVEAFFDLFTGDSSLLLLMQRDVIDASVTHRRFLSKPQYDYFMSLIARSAADVKGEPIHRDTAFTVGSLIFGYCELLKVVHEFYDQQSEEQRLGERQRLVRASVKLLAAD